MYFYRNIFLKTVHDARHYTLAFGAALFLIGLVVTLLYPEAVINYNDMITVLPEFLRGLIGYTSEIDTAEGFLTIELFSVLAPIVMIGFAVGIGSIAIAGEEQQQTLDQLLANPIMRSYVINHKALALLILCLALAGALTIGLVVGSLSRGYMLNASKMLQMVASLLLLSWALGMAALAIGGTTGRVSFAVAAPLTAAAAGLLISSIDSMFETMPYARYLSVMYYYIGNKPFINGINFWHAFVLLALTIASFVVARRSFNLRDLS